MPRQPLLSNCNIVSSARSLAIAASEPARHWHAIHSQHTANKGTVKNVFKHCVGKSGKQYQIQSQQRKTDSLEVKQKLSQMWQKSLHLRKLLEKPYMKLSNVRKASHQSLLTSKYAPSHALHFHYGTRWRTRNPAIAGITSVLEGFTHTETGQKTCPSCSH